MKRFTVLLIALSLLFAFSAFAQPPQAPLAKNQSTISGKIAELAGTGLNNFMDGKNIPTKMAKPPSKRPPKPGKTGPSTGGKGGNPK